MGGTMVFLTIVRMLVFKLQDRLHPEKTCTSLLVHLVERSSYQSRMQPQLLILYGFLKICVRIAEQFPLLLCFHRFHKGYWVPRVEQVRAQASMAENIDERQRQSYQRCSFCHHLVYVRRRSFFPLAHDREAHFARPTLPPLGQSRSRYRITHFARPTLLQHSRIG
jgi:hypothetical protein